MIIRNVIKSLFKLQHNYFDIIGVILYMTIINELINSSNLEVPVWTVFLFFVPLLTLWAYISSLISKYIKDKG